MAKEQGIVRPFYYLDGITINPSDNSNPGGLIQIKRPYSILENATEWDLAIMRAVYPMNAIPLGIAPVALSPVFDNTSPQSLALQVSLLRSGTYSQPFVAWTPEFTDQPAPVNTGSQITAQNLTTKYYWYSTIAHLLGCMNATLSAASTAVSATNPPFITYDPVASLFSIFLPTTDYGTTAANPVTLMWNPVMAQYFPNFYSYTAMTTAAFGTPTVTTTVRVPVTTSYVTINSINYIQLIQECPNVTQWDCLANISMNTDLGIVPEDIATNSSTIATSSTAVSPQLTDICLDSGTGQLMGGSRSGIAEYLPVPLPRWVNLRTTAFTSFNIFLNWMSKTGQVYPLVLPPGSQASMKLLFRHRSSRGSDTY